MELMDQLLQQQQPTNGQPMPQQGAGMPQQGASIMDTMGPMVTNPAEDFLVTMMQIADNHGILDQAFGPGSVEDQMDVAQAPDPMQFLDREELMTLVTKFMAIPEPQRTEIANTLRQELPPQVSQRLDAVLRFSQGRDAQVGMK